MKKVLMLETEIKQCIQTLASEIAKDCEDLQSLVLVGVFPEGPFIADRIAHVIQENHNCQIAVGYLDVTLFLDHSLHNEQYIDIYQTDIPVNLKNKHVVLIQDILFTGNRVRAAFNSLSYFDSPGTIKLAVLLDRGHRRLPVFANYTGKVIETNFEDHVQVKLAEEQGSDCVEKIINLYSDTMPTQHEMAL